MKDPHQESTLRSIVTNNRSAVFVLALHSTLTVEKLRCALKKDLKGVRLSEESRLSWLQYCQVQRLFPLPEDQRFWNALLYADEMEQCYRNEPEYQAERVVKKYLQEKCPEEFSWIPVSERFFVVLKSIRTDAQMELKRISNEYCVLWERGKALWGKKDRTEEEKRCIENGRNGLLAVVQGGLIQESWVSQAIWELQYQVIANNYPQKEKTEAKALLREIGKALSQIGSGKDKIDVEEKEAIIDDCKNWYPICEGLNKEFIVLREQPAYCSSELNRKEERERLAEKFSIPIEDVKAIEWSLKTSSRKGSKKSTPTQAMCHRVAREHFVRGKTVEKIWNEYTRDHPEWGKRRRPPLTIPVAGRTV